MKKCKWHFLRNRVYCLPCIDNAFPTARMRICIMLSNCQSDLCVSKLYRLKLRLQWVRWPHLHFIRSFSSHVALFLKRIRQSLSVKANKTEAISLRYLKIIKNCRNSILKLKVYVQDFITHPSAQCRRICQNKSLWQFKNIMYLRSLAVGNALSIKGRQYTISREKCRLHFFISVISIKSIIKMKKSLHFFHLIFYNSTFSKLVCHSTSE